LVDAFEQTAVYVEGVANGDIAIIDQSGFKASKTAFHNAEPPAQLLIKAHGNIGHGSIHYQCADAGHPDGYLTLGIKNDLPENFTLTVDGDVLKIRVNETEIYIKPGTKGKGDFTGLQRRGELFKVLMLAFNSAGISPVSEPASVTIP
jgi:hypothetical protein